MSSLADIGREALGCWALRPAPAGEGDLAACLCDGESSTATAAAAAASYAALRSAAASFARRLALVCRLPSSFPVAPRFVKPAADAVGVRACCNGACCWRSDASACSRATRSCCSSAPSRATSARTCCSSSESRPSFSLEALSSWLSDSMRFSCIATVRRNDSASRCSASSVDAGTVAAGAGPSGERDQTGALMRSVPLSVGCRGTTRALAGVWSATAPEELVTA
mmetsp:Transcript_139315/g.388790  ORF Transcript_139315/g.388790 Transcript_139315/m.388790 type:complete len:225 (-) Transcript_139315:420-1094(-)